MVNMEAYLSAILSEEVYVVCSPRRVKFNNIDYIKIICPNNYITLFEIIKEMELKKGFQGIACRNIRTNEIIVAFRGTEVSLKKPFESFRDLKADIEMVFLRRNPQFEESKQLTNFALQYADELSSKTGQTIPVSLTGHSLGGSIAQFNAHYYEGRISQTHTFNAYGVESLGYGIPKKKVSNVKNHVMATDFVSAASHHYGDVVIYADKSDIRTLNMTCYRNKENTLISGLVLTATLLSAKKHSISNFTKKNVLYIRKYEKIAIEKKHQINNYRNDIFRIRSIATAVYLPKTMKLCFSGNCFS